MIIVPKLALGQVLGPDRGPIETQQSPAMEDTIDDGVGEIIVVERRAPAPWVLVGREDHRALLDVPLVDHVKQDVGGVVAVRQIADLVD